MTVDALGAVAPVALTDTRIELHWLAQVISAAGDAFLERAPDDSHSNCAWDHTHSALVGRPIGDGARIGLVVAEAELIVIAADGSVRERVAARGKSLSELMSWSGTTIAAASGVSPKAPPTARDYDMPEHAVASGQAFALADDNATAELARWFASATGWLARARTIDDRASEVRCWPHHFDIGGIIMLEPDKPFEEARQMGFGWSPGDASYDQPYLYATPYPVPDTLPELSGGHWHREGFTGAILTGTDVAAATDAQAQSALVQTFLGSTIERTLPLIQE